MKFQKNKFKSLLLSTKISQNKYNFQILGKTSVDDLNKNLEPKPTIQGIKVGDIVEIIKGPFRGGKAKIVTFTSIREEITF